MSNSYKDDLESIRPLMDRSVKFISLSGLSGILAGIYALVGAGLAYSSLQYKSVVDYRTNSVQNPAIFQKLIAIAAVVLIASLATGFLLTIRKSKRQGIKINLANTKRLAINLAIPLVAGGIFILVLLSKGHYGVVAPASLIFYGLALINASPNLYEEVRYLGYCEIAVGLIAAYFSGLGLLFWAIGFGGLHVVYGAAMYRKYDA
jgi:predicted lysophospholipase L1 biosynthesis ABC-type transport system permease subunit